MRPRKLNMVCGESNEIKYGEQNCFELTAEKKNCLLLIRSEKNCVFKLGVKKKFDHKGKPYPPPHVSNGPTLNPRHAYGQVLALVYYTKHTFFSISITFPN